MRTSRGLTVVAAVFAFTTGAGYSGEYAKGGERQYERHGSYENEFYGKVDALPKDRIGIWIIDGQQVEVTKETFIDEEHGMAKAGAHAEVKGRRDGKIFRAYRIEIKGAGR